MDADIRERTLNYLNARHQHPAWVLLASMRAPLVLSCLQTLFEHSRDGIALEDALQALADMLAQYAHNSDLEITSEDFHAQARKELRIWIKRMLVIEREGRLYATDALEEALRFVAALGERIMTSTASRLSIVQREIENLEAELNPDPKSRALHLRRKIADLERDLQDVEHGKIDTLKDAEAIERMREVYNLATSLRADFRRVEDSWREADRQLRQSIVSEQSHRGEIVDKLLDGHDTLLDTPEGRVFHGFQQQLGRPIELNQMKLHLRSILKHPITDLALNRTQQAELRWLIMRLVKESASVIQARARSERDVKGFLKTGLAAEHHRVGMLLNDIFQAALDVDWGSQSVRRKPGPLPPIAIPLAGLPIAERLLFKTLEGAEKGELELTRKEGNIEDIDEDFWLAFNGLDREALLNDTLNLLKRSPQPLSIAAIANHLPPTHDLESIALWVSLAREAEAPFRAAREELDITANDGTRLRFDVPKVSLSAAAVENLDWEP
jgi:hypothetical protein